MALCEVPEMFLILCFQLIIISYCYTVEGQPNNAYINVAEKRDDTPLSEYRDTKPVCDAQSLCVPIKSCPLLDDLLDPSCLSSDKYFRRLNSLTCGHAGGESLVCCPSGGYTGLARPSTPPQSPASSSPPERCGDPVIRGPNYDGMGAHPWVARIGFMNKQNGRLRFPCSGTIISKRVILTAAHCALAKADNFKLSSVVVGEWDTEFSTDCNELFCAKEAQSIAIDHVVVHPGYEKKIFRHDVALVVLKEAILYTATSAPLCLLESLDAVPDNRATLVGWGKLSGQASQPPQQQQLEVPLQPLHRCEAVFRDLVPVHEGQLCAGGEAGKDACTGFGGSPLIAKVRDRFTQIGIVSFGSESCGSPGVPSVYTSVSFYVKWIRENSPADAK